MKSRFIRDSRFFFTSFHTGTVNIVLHIMSVLILLYGLVYKDIWIAFIGLAVIDEVGHIYNYVHVHKKDPLYNPIRMLPYQALYVLPVGLVLFKVFGLI